MRGFLIAIGLLAVNLFGCGIAFFAGQTGIVVPLFISFFVLYGVAAFRAGRGVEFRTPVLQRHNAQSRRRARFSVEELGIE